MEGALHSGPYTKREMARERIELVRLFGGYRDYESVGGGCGAGGMSGHVLPYLGLLLGGIGGTENAIAVIHVVDRSDEYP
jgi:hypothetical protein